MEKNTKLFLDSRDMMKDLVSEAIFRDIEVHDELMNVDFDTIKDSEFNLNDFIISNENRTKKFNVKITIDEV